MARRPAPQMQRSPPCVADCASGRECGVGNARKALPSEDTGPIIRDMDAKVSARGVELLPELRPTTELRFRLAALHGLVPVLESRGVSPDTLLQRVGLTRADLADATRTSTYAAADALLCECAAATGCDDIGMLVGQHVGLRAVGIVGRLMANARTVGEALQDLQSTMGLQDSAVQVMLTRDRGRMVLEVDVPARGFRNADHVHDTVIAAGCSLIRGLCGPSWCPDEVRLRRVAPSDVGNYREFYRAPIHFGSSQVALVFPDAWLERPVRGADPLVRKILLERITAALAGREPLLIAEVRHAIRSSMKAGRCTRAIVAELLGVHERTFGRRLNGAGLSFQALLDEARSTAARELLQDPERSLTDVARALGYHDVTVFTRAFVRWTGTTPRAFRAQRAPR